LYSDIYYDTNEFETTIQYRAYFTYSTRFVGCASTLLGLMRGRASRL